MEKIPTSPVDFGCLFAALVFIGHIAANFLLTGRPGAEFNRFEKLSLFPPFWVFGIWAVIWSLQAAMLLKSYNSGLWTASMTLIFVLMCLGNIGSQWAGAKGLGAAVYLGFLGMMLAASFAWLRLTETGATGTPFLASASQLYLGWAIIAFVVGLGVVLVCDKQVVADAFYSRAGLLLLVAIPAVIWWSYSRNLADYRVVSAPFLLVLLAFAMRAFQSHRGLFQVSGT